MGKILEIRDLTVSYFIGKLTITAIEGVNADVQDGEIVAIVGESGSGKSTLGNAILRAVRPPGRITRGSIIFQGRDMTTMSDDDLKKIRWRKLSFVPQASQNAFSPTMRIKKHFEDTMRAQGVKDNEKIDETTTHYLTEVMLESDRVLNSYPHELSGGMKQRVAIALSLVLDPQLVVFDEPTSALDVVTQHTILDLILRVHAQTNIAILFITHDISLVRGFSDRTIVMYAGRVAEVGKTTEILDSPLHPYTYFLLKAVPTLASDSEQVSSIPGDPPTDAQAISGCKFHPRCLYAKDICRNLEPGLREISPGHLSACHFSGELTFREVS